VTAAARATVLGEERRIMNLYAPHYDVATLTNSYVYRLVRAGFVDWVVQVLRDAGREPARLSVLDVGCGPGTATALLAAAGFERLIGLDLADGMLVEARRRALPGARWVQATVEDPPFGPASFDVVLAVFTLHHLYDPAAFFRLADRTLRPGGWYFVLEYDDSTVVDASRHETRRALGDVVRRAFARKNRRHLASRPVLPALFNPAHRPLGFEGIRRAMTEPAAYEVRRETRGVLLPALLPVLVEESALDRTIARCADRVDRWLARGTGGLFQWLAGRRRPGL
jgi:ubiquinone/menaquinone biosynthesis C-methylase UbiE